MMSFQVQELRPEVLAFALLMEAALREWEDTFIGSVIERTDEGKNTTLLSAKQVEIIERIHSKHFA